MSDFEKLKQLVLFLLLFVATAPWVVSSEPMLAICTDFKTYEQYWHYYHNMKN